VSVIRDSSAISAATERARSPRRDADPRAAPSAWCTFLAVARREWLGIVLSPVGWIALAAFAVPPGLAFASGSLVPGAPVTMRLPLMIAAWSLFVVAPVLAWRSVGEERRAGTWDLLVASPAGPGAIVLGKLASQGVFLLLLGLPLAIQCALLSTVARPDIGEFACGLLGVLLAGAVVLASAFWLAVVSPGPAAAYLLTIGLWSAWILVGRAMPTVTPPEWTAAAHALDPLRRVDDFLLGILDPADLVFLLAVGAFFVVAAIDAVAEGTRGAASMRRRTLRAVLLVGVGTSAVLAVALASQPVLRHSVDLTRTRAWTLGERTREVVASLAGDWRIEAIAGPDSVDALALRQLDEVLARFNGLPTRGGVVRAGRIDPADPAQSASFDESLERLERTYAAPLAAQRVAIDRGIAAFERLAAWAGAESNALAALLASIPTEAEVAASGAAGAAGVPAAAGAVLIDADRSALEQWRATLARLATDHRAFVEERRAQARSSARSPLGDAAGAAMLVDAALRAWIEQCAGVEQALRELRRRDRLPPEVAEYLRDAPRRALDMAQQLANAQDQLARLPELALAEVAAALRGGDAVIVSGPDRAAAIPGWQLLPPAMGSSGGGASGASAFDRRFRGEEVIAAAIRSLDRGVAPEVVFVHAEGRTLLRPSADRADLAAITDSLRSARCAVREWQPAAEPRPPGREGRRTVWVVVPPLRRTGVEPDPRERRLLEACSRLIDAGEPLLLAVAPSVLPLVGQPDPWVEMARRIGVDARTESTLLELVATSERGREVRAYFEVEGQASHPASRGASGMSTLVSEPVRLERLSRVDGASSDAAPSAQVETLVEIAPARQRWIEDDWRSAARRTTEVPEAKRLESPAVVLAAVERGEGRRSVISGGAAWMLSGLADLTGQLGPDRVFLRYPGNRELFIGCIGWLAGLDEGFAGGSGREVERVPALVASQRGAIAAAGAAGVPASALAMAWFIGWRRRRA